MDLSAVIVAIAAAAGLLAIRSKLMASGKAGEGWRRAAEKVSGSLTESPPRIEWRKHGIRLSLSTRREGQERVTSARARVPADPSWRLRVERSGILGGALLGSSSPRFETQDADFDRVWIVSGYPIPLFTELFDDATRRLMLGVGEGFVVQRGALVVERPGETDDADLLVAMMEFTEKLASRWYDVIRSPRRAAAGLGLSSLDGIAARPDGLVPIARGIRRGREVTLSTRVGDEALSTVVEVGALAEVDFSWKAGEPSAALPASLAPLALAPPDALVGLSQSGLTIAIELAGVDVSGPDAANAVDAVLDALGAGGYR